jgi:hypothetical protein
MRTQATDDRPAWCAVRDTIIRHNNHIPKGHVLRGARPTRPDGNFNMDFGAANDAAAAVMAENTRGAVVLVKAGPADRADEIMSRPPMAGLARGATVKGHTVYRPRTAFENQKVPPVPLFRPRHTDPGKRVFIGGMPRMAGETFQLKRVVAAERDLVVPANEAARVLLQDAAALN